LLGEVKNAHFIYAIGAPTAIFAFETFGRRLESTSSGHRGREESAKRLIERGQVGRLGQKRALSVALKYKDDIRERVIFPITLAQANGIEDAWLLAFEDEGQRTYYATYTAYSGGAIRSELLETTDFRSFRMTPLRGAAAATREWVFSLARSAAATR
jgi:hypothetical protein